MAKGSRASFWIKHIILATVVVGVAIAVLTFEGTNPQKSIASSAQTPEQHATIHENLSRFYENFRVSSRYQIEERYGDNVIPINKSEQTVAQQLISMGTVRFPPAQNWQGEQKVRPFPEGSTLRTEAMRYAEEEGLTLIWDLDQDFVIMDRFQTYETLAGTMREISGAIDSNFPDEVRTFLCAQKNALVITASPQEYLFERCRSLTFNDF